MADKDCVDSAFAAKDPFGMGAEPTFSGALSLFRRRYSKDLAGADVAISGVPYDTAVTNRPGTRFGPRAIRQASTNLAWAGGAWRWPFDPFDILNAVDFGDCLFDHGDPASVPASIEAHAGALLASGARMLTLGGDHFITYPVLKAHAKKHGAVALLQFDSHSDTWRDDDSRQDGAKRLDHGTMFFHAAQEGVIDVARSVQVGLRSRNDETHGFTVLDADFVAEHGPAEIAKRIGEVVGQGPCYLTFDIDFLDPAYAPGTGTPVCGGPSSWKAEKILSLLGGLDIVGADVVEVSPSYDVGEITALAAATMALNIICLWAERKQRAG